VVGDVLLEIADGNRMISRWPKPYLYFHGFDDVAMRMQLRVFLIDINNFLDVTNALHFEIARRLREMDIPFPRPHSDVRLRRDDVQDAMLGPVAMDRPDP
jgi:small-conductance mechanosensitive channel